jgi:hypothetical protein
MRVDIGDILEAGVEEGKITFSLLSLVDRHLAEGLGDARKVEGMGVVPPRGKLLPPWTRGLRPVSKSAVNEAALRFTERATKDQNAVGEAVKNSVMIYCRPDAAVGPG